MSGLTRISATDAAVSAEALPEFCKSSLASYKVPRHVFVISEAEVPRMGSGKVEKAALRRAAAARLGGEPD